LIGIYRVVLVCCFLLITACTTNNEENQVDSFNQSADEECNHCNVNFWIKKYTRTHIDGAFKLFKLKTDELTKRQRKGRIIQFNNYKELYIKGLSIDQPLNTKIVKFDMNEITSLTSFDDNQVAANDNSGTNNKTLTQPNYQLLGKTLSRVLVDEVRITFKPSKKPPIVLAAKSAKILTDTMIIRFEGDVTVEAKKCKISSRVALWSNVYNGLFLSESYQYNNRKYETPAFFKITDNGGCLKVSGVHVEEYVDPLDIIENKIFESTPESVRLLFGLMGTLTTNQ
jgi:hypothetical protein